MSRQGNLSLPVFLPKWSSGRVTVSTGMSEVPVKNGFVVLYAVLFAMEVPLPTSFIFAIIQFCVSDMALT